jgi:hypothetical protein
VSRDHPAIFVGEISTSQDFYGILGRRDSVEPSEKKQPASRRSPLSPEEREDQTQYNANNDAGDDGEIENRIAALDPNVARKFAEKAGADSAPEQNAKNDDHASHDNENFSDLGHVRNFPTKTRHVEQTREISLRRLQR